MGPGTQFRRVPAHLNHWILVLSKKVWISEAFCKKLKKLKMTCKQTTARQQILVKSRKQHRIKKVITISACYIFSLLYLSFVHTSFLTFFKMSCRSFSEFSRPSPTSLSLGKTHDNHLRWKVPEIRNSGDSKATGFDNRVKIVDFLPHVKFSSFVECNAHGYMHVIPLLSLLRYFTKLYKPCITVLRVVPGSYAKRLWQGVDEFDGIVVLAADFIDQEVK